MGTKFGGSSGSKRPTGTAHAGALGLAGTNPNVGSWIPGQHLPLPYCIHRTTIYMCTILHI